MKCKVCSYDHSEFDRLWCDRSENDYIQKFIAEAFPEGLDALITARAMALATLKPVRFTKQTNIKILGGTLVLELTFGETITNEVK